MTPDDALGVMLYGVGEDGSVRSAKVSKSGRLLTMEYAHYAVHHDEFVTASEYVADLDISGPRRYLVRPLAGYDLHSVFLIKVSAAVRVQLYESPTVTGVGTRINHMRNNRQGLIADTARDTTYHSPTTSALGTLILDTYTGGAGGNVQTRVGGESRSGQELVLHHEKDVLLVLTALADNTVLAFSHEYYEVLR